MTPRTRHRTRRHPLGRPISCKLSRAARPYASPQPPPRVRRAADQSDRLGANATIAPKIAAWRHPQRIHWPRTAPQPRATLTRALTQACVLAPRSARSATRTAAADRQSSCYSHSPVDLRTGGGVGGTRAVAKAAPLLPAEQPRQRSGEAGSARRASALASTLATHLLAHQLVTA